MTVWAVIAGGWLSAGLLAAGEPAFVRLGYVSPEERFYLLRVVRTKVSPGMGLPAPPEPPTRLARPDTRPVFLSLFCGGRRSARIESAGTTIADSMAAAASRLASYCRRFAWGKDALARGRIKIDLLDQVRPFRLHSGRLVAEQIALGVDGLIIDAPAGHTRVRVTFLPLALLRYSSHPDILIPAYAEEGWETPRVRAKDARIEAIRTLAFIEDCPGGLPIPLYRGNVVRERVYQDTVNRSLLRAAVWLMRSQQPDGRFLYEYDPLRGQALKGYNMVRHIGSAHVLYMLYGILKDQNLLDAGDRCVKYAKEFLHPAPLPLGEKFAHVAVNGHSVLGASALLLQGLARRASATGRVSDLGLMEALGDFIRFMTMPNGRVYRELLEVLSGKPPKTEPRYCPGQAMLGLCLLYRHSRKAKWLKCAERIANYQISRFTRGAAPDHWVANGLAELYLVSKRSKYADACLRMADKALETMIAGNDARFPDHVGGFGAAGEPLLIAAATRGETLSAAYRLAWAVDKDRAWRYGDALMRVAGFLIRNQFTAENGYFIREPQRVIGAFRRSPTDLSVRMDYAQHGILALLGASDVAGRREPASRERASAPKQ